MPELATDGPTKSCAILVIEEALGADKGLAGRGMVCRTTGHAGRGGALIQGCGKGSVILLECRGIVGLRE